MLLKNFFLTWTLKSSLNLVIHSALGVLLVLIFKQSLILFDAFFFISVDIPTDIVTDNKNTGLDTSISRNQRNSNIQNFEGSFSSESSFDSGDYGIDTLVDNPPVSIHPDFVPDEIPVRTDVPADAPVKKEPDIVTIVLIVVAFSIIVVLGSTCGERWF